MRRSLAALFVSATLVGCSGSIPLIEPSDGPPSGNVGVADLPGEPTPRPEPRSRYGNTPEYEVLGRTYRVLPSSRNYRERGVASWYGKKFHGRLTSNREPYDMFAMTAAHKTLPLPTYVRVRNLSNNRSIIVRVNDRGPFAHNRLIDLSYGAALKLDIVKTGTSLVEVTAIDFDAHTDTQDFSAPDRDGSVYVQIGAFGSRDNAGRLQSRLQDAGIKDSFVYIDQERRDLFRVRIGPVRDVEYYDELTNRLETLGIRDQYLVTR
jgi:rare lipoprotein A